jgi:hypothetical protein
MNSHDVLDPVRLRLDEGISVEVGRLISTFIYLDWKEPPLS